MATLTGKLVAETYKALLKTINNDVITASEVQISDGFGQGTNVFLDQNGFVRASKYKVTGGNSSQFLKGDGSLDSTSYLPSGTTTTSIPEGTNKYFTELRVLDSNLAGFTPVSGSVSSADSVLTALEKIWWNILNGGGGGGGGYVPYSGATQNLNLGEFGLLAGNIRFDTTPTNIPTAQGTMYWDADHSTVALIMNGLLQKVGEDLVYPVKNQTGATITKGTAVGFAGTLGASGRLLISPFLANGTQPSSYFMGIVSENIADGDDGFVTYLGQIRQLNTSAYPADSILYVSPTTAGALTATKPIAPNNIIQVAAVINSATNGTLQVRITLGSSLKDDEMVYLNPATLANNDGIFYNATTERFENRDLIKTDGFIPYFDSTDLLKESPIFVDGVNVTMNGMPLLLSDEGELNYITKFGSTKTVINSLLYDTGVNVGLGTTNPLFKFHIQGGDLGIYNSSTAYGYQIFTNSNYRFASATGFQFLVDDVNTGSVQVRIDTLGRLGVGVVTPAYKIDAGGDINISTGSVYRIAGNPYSVASATLSGFLTSTDWTTFNNKTSSNGTLNYLAKYSSYNTLVDSLLYDSGTKIGINTTNPEFLFTVVGGSMGVYSSSTNYGYIDTANTSMRLVSANGFNFTANNIGTIANTRVDANGNWGFGIGTPSYKVDVNGDVNINGNYRINGSLLSTSNIAEGTNLYFTSNRVLGQVLTGLNTSLTGVVTSADSLIVGISKLQNQVSSIVSGVSSVFGRTGAVVAQSGDYTTAQVTESSNLYYTDARARGALSAGSGISYNNTTGVISSTITQYTDAMARASLSFVAGSGAYNSTTGVITIPTNTNQLTNGANYITLASLSASSPLSYNSGTGVFSISQASGTTNGFLSSTDWTTFNNKQNALGYTPVPTTRTITINGTTQDLSADRTFTVAGTISGLTTNYVPKATSATTIGNSNLQEVSGNLGLGVTPSAWGTNKVFQINSGFVQIDTASNFGIGRNAYQNSSFQWRYIANGFGSMFNIESDGAFKWFTAPNNTGGADTAISFTQAMTLDASGNLMVGTTSPLLNASGRGNITVNGSSSSILTLGVGAGYSGYFYADATKVELSTNAQPMTFVTNGAERFRINSNGTVSIGNTNNTYKLDVSGTGRFQHNDTPIRLDNNGGTFTQLDFLNNGTQKGAIWWNNSTSTLNLWTGVTALTITSTGNVGIGTTSPIGKLHIQGEASGQSIRTDNSAAYSFLYSTISNANPIAFDNNAGNLIIYTGGSERMRITSTGNVGVGVTNPSYKLDIAGDLNISTGSVFRIGGTAVSLFTGSGTTNYHVKFTGATSLGNSSIFDNGSAIGFYTASPAGVFQVAGSGNIFFGDTPSNTNYKFNVKGFSGNYISFWTPTLGGVNQNGIMSHSGAGLGAVTPLGYYASTHIFGGEVTGGGLVQVAGDVNISGTFRVNGTAIGTGGGGVSGSGTTGYHAKWSSSTSLTNSIINESGDEVGVNGSNFPRFTFRSGATYRGMIGINTDNLFWIASAGSTELILSTNSLGRISIKGDGKILFNSSTGGNLILEATGGGDSALYTTLSGNLRAVARFTQDFTNYRGVGFGYDAGDQLGFIYGTTTGSTASKLGLLVYNGSSWVNMLIAKSNTINLPSLPTSTSGLVFGDLYVDANGFVKRYNVV